MPIIVTGAEGFIGSHLVEELLAKGEKVRALVQYNFMNSVGWLESVRGNPDLEIFFGDVKDQGQMKSLVKDATTIFHLAALISIPYSYRAPQSYFETNVMGTLNLLEAAKESAVKRLIVTSTSEVYGSARTVPISESHVLQAQSPYSASKISADALAFSYWSAFELPIVTIRPFNTFGPRQSRRAVIPTIMSQVLGGNSTIQLGSTSPTRDFTFVSDTVSGFIAAMHARDIEGQVINLGTGFEVSISDLVGLIGKVAGTEVIVNSELERTRPKNSEVERLVSDNRKAFDLLDWRPELSGREGLIRGLELTRDWMQSVDVSSIGDGEYVS